MISEDELEFLHKTAAEEDSDDEDAEVVFTTNEGGLSMQQEMSQDDDYQTHKGRSTADIMDVQKFHERGYKGKGIKIAILDSGLGQEF